jgi:ABC-type uncharacterized transport system ATPase subunit
MTADIKKPACAVECRAITKSFGSVSANDNVSLSLYYGEILAVLGENGSGKTTLMNILSGIYRPDSGVVIVDGKEAAINSPIDAAELGIGMIHQHFKLVEAFSAMDNIVMGTKGKKNPPKKMAKNICALCSRYGFDIDPFKRVRDMSVSERQTVEIIKVLYRGAKILILDEPTAVLTPQETEHLFKILDNIRKKGSAIIIITHKLNEVMQLSDKVSILRKGRSIATVRTENTDENELTEHMVGRPVSLKIERPKPQNPKTVLSVYNLTVKTPDGATAIDDLSFEMRSGEILGVAGVAGSGQKQLCEAIAGLAKAQKGAVLFEKENILGKTPAQIISLGIQMSFVPEDRLGMGLISSMGMVDNMLLKSYRDTLGIFVSSRASRELAGRLVKRLSIDTPSVDTPVRMLSGGNVQKVLLGREIESKPNLLITAYPVRGLDINSSHLVYKLLNEQKQKGVPIMFIGEDLDVLLELSDKILVLCHGKRTGLVDADKVTKEQLGLMMAGKTFEEAPAC